MSISITKILHIVTTTVMFSMSILSAQGFSLSNQLVYCTASIFFAALLLVNCFILLNSHKNTCIEEKIYAITAVTVVLSSKNAILYLSALAAILMVIHKYYESRKISKAVVAVFLLFLLLSMFNKVVGTIYNADGQLSVVKYTEIYCDISPSGRKVLTRTQAIYGYDGITEFFVTTDYGVVKQKVRIKSASSDEIGGSSVFITERLVQINGKNYSV